MVSGSFVLTDTIQKSFDAVFDDSYEHADVVISSKEAIEAGAEDAPPPAFSDEVLATVRGLAGVETAAGTVGGPVGLVGADGEPIGDGGSGDLGRRLPTGSLNPLKLVSGDWPRGSGEIAIDKSTADDEQLAHRRHDRRVRRRAGAAATASPASSSSRRATRSAAARSPSSTCRPRSGCSTSAASSTRSRWPREPGVSPDELCEADRCAAAADGGGPDGDGEGGRCDRRGRK